MSITPPTQNTADASRPGTTELRCNLAARLQIKHGDIVRKQRDDIGDILPVGTEPNISGCLTNRDSMLSGAPTKNSISVSVPTVATIIPTTRPMPVARASALDRTIPVSAAPSNIMHRAVLG